MNENQVIHLPAMRLTELPIKLLKGKNHLEVML